MLLEDYSSEALNEIIAVLKSRAKRCNGFQVTTRSIQDMLQRRFGLAPPATKYLLSYIIGFLEGKNVLEVFDTKPNLMIYDVDIDNLNKL